MPFSGSRWAIWALVLGGFGIGTTEFVAMGLLPEIAVSIGESEPTTGHVISAYALGVVVGAPLISALTAAVPRKALLIALMVAFTVGNGLTLLADSYPTLMAARFLAGLPHGAYFGVAGLVAAHLAPEGHRARAVGQVIMGLSVANVAGVPLAALLGNNFGWRAAFALVVAIGIATVIALSSLLPSLPDIRTSNPLAELGALRNSRVWFTLAVGAVGFGGMFAFYTYLASTLDEVSGLGQAWVPLALGLYGAGMVLGNIVGGHLADKALTGSMIGWLIVMIAVLTGFAAFAGIAFLALLFTFLIGVAGAALVPALQTRLMDVAGPAQTLAGALNHSALNIANASGAFFGGVVIDIGWGYRAPALLGAVLASLGLGVVFVALWRERTWRERGMSDRVSKVSA